MNYEYKTVLGNVRVREQREDETHFEYSLAPMSDLLVVDNPAPPSADGWELVQSTFVMGKDVRWFVAREWRREIKSPAPVGNVEMPDKEIILDWMRMAHNRVEEQARAKQKGIWQGDLDDAAAEYIAERLKELQTAKKLPALGSDEEDAFVAHLMETTAVSSIKLRAILEYIRDELT